jgi:predicted ester cyclase
MSTETNKAVVRRLLEDILSDGQLDVADEIIADGYQDSGPVAVPGLPPGPEGMKMFATFYRTAFPDIRFTVEEQIAEGDVVATRWTSTATHAGQLDEIPPSNNKVNCSGVSIDRVVDGKMVEGWGVFDELGMLRQMGVISSEA